MKKTKNQTSKTIGVMLVISLAILLIYYYTSSSTKPLIDNSDENLSEVDKILKEDFVSNYPATPRETVKVFARIMRALYNNPKDDEIDPLALKIRELYDDEFLDNNPEDSYLINLKTDIAKWQKEKRTITNYILVKKDQEEEKVIDGVKYSVNYVQYTIQENGKFTETWKVLLREDSNKRWKILGWEFVPKDNSED